MDTLKQQPNLHIQEYWECDILRELAADPELKTKYDNYTAITPYLKLRNALCGGRTEPDKVFFNAKDNCYGSVKFI